MVDSVSGAGSQSINLQGNLKDLKTKTVQLEQSQSNSATQGADPSGGTNSTENSGSTDQSNSSNKTNSVFVSSVKVYATDDTNQKGQVSYNELKNKSVFDSVRNLDGSNTKNNAFNGLSDTAKNIANNKAQNTLTSIINGKGEKWIQKFKAITDKIHLQNDTHPGLQQSDVDSATSALDQKVEPQAQSHATSTQEKILKAYNDALQDIAKEAEKEAKQEDLKNAMQADMNNANKPTQDVNTPQNTSNSTKFNFQNPSASFKNGFSTNLNNNNFWTKLAGGLSNSASDLLNSSLNNMFTTGGTNNKSGVSNSTSTSPAAAKPQDAKSSTYTIKSGDTLFEIARDTDTNIVELYNKNKSGDAFKPATKDGNTCGISYKKGEADPNKIRTGKTLKL